MSEISDFDDDDPELELLVRQEEEESIYVDSELDDTAWEPLQDWQPAATFDVLCLTSLLGEQSAPGRMELHSFAYLACLMSVFSGRPASEWGYAFSAVPPTLPFSPSIEAALADLVASGRLEWVAKVAGGTPREYRLTADGQDEFEFLREMQSFSPRIKFLHASAMTAVFASIPAVVNSLNYEPQLAQALRLESARMLLTRVSSLPLYREFYALEEALGPDHRELVVPASLYVQYLQQRARAAFEGT
ncbi:MAG: hypothetical protein ACTHON_16240, partial [Humibacter sp.]